MTAPDETAAPEVTPGQVLRATLVACRGQRGEYDCRSWAQLSEEERGDLEAGAKAAIGAGLSRVLDQGARYMAERDELAALVAAARRPITAEELAPLLWEAACAEMRRRDRDPMIGTWEEFTSAFPDHAAAHVAAAREALKPTVADLDQAAELIRAQDAERELARQLRDLRGIAGDTGLTRRQQDQAIREYLASTAPEAQS